jgi:hypothetical protein
MIGLKIRIFPFTINGISFFRQSAPRRQFFYCTAAILLLFLPDRPGKGIPHNRAAKAGTRRAPILNKESAYVN